MKPGRLSLASFDLGAARCGAADAFLRLTALAGSSRGFLLKKEGTSPRVFMGARPFETLRVSGGRVISETAAGKKTLAGNPFKALGKRLGEFKVAAGPEFTSGAVGYLGYEMAGYLERIPKRPLKQEAVIMLFDRIVVFERGRARLWALLPGRSAAKARKSASRFAEKLSLALGARGAKPQRPYKRLPRLELAPIKGTMGRPAFLRGVRRIKELIGEGDMFQCVLSERFSARTAADPVKVFKSLELEGGSPYLFLLKDADEHLVGASPERLVGVFGRKLLNMPIAGTRPRGGDARRDKNLERALKRSPKERAEHLMLVDLARNDLGRVSEPGSVRVRELMAVRKYSHVMHLVSEVEGRLEKGLTAWDAMAASFPAGTVSGAPKVRAMERLARLEPAARGFYAGALVQHDFSGNMDSCIAIRTMSIKGGRVVLQAGAGVVADSGPAREYREVLSKLRGLRWALAHAGRR